MITGKAILTVLNPNDRNSFNLERGDTIKLPAGTTAYLVNQDDNENLRVVDLVIPVNRPGKFQVISINDANLFFASIASFIPTPTIDLCPFFFSLLTYLEVKTNNHTSADSARIF
jgi:hypothetical protein